MQAELTTLHGRQHRRNARKLLVEITRVLVILDGRFEWWWNSLGVYILPIDVLEKGVAHDLLGISWATTQSHLRLACQ